MIGGALFMFVGGIHYWWPKITGRMYPENFARFCCLVQFVGFNLTFFPQFVMGTHGMVRRYATYLPEFQPYHVLSSIGAFTQMAAMLLILGYLIWSLYRGRRAPANPWGGSTLEWACASPPPYDNFPSPPSVGEPYDHTGLVWNETEKGYERRN